MTETHIIELFIKLTFSGALLGAGFAYLLAFFQGR